MRCADMDDDEVGEAAHQINEHDDRGAADAVLKTEMNGAGTGASGPAATAGEAKPRPKMAGGSWAIQQMQGVQKQRLDNKPPLLARHQRNDAAANRERRAAEQAALHAHVERRCRLCRRAASWARGSHNPGG